MLLSFDLDSKVRASVRFRSAYTEISEKYNGQAVREIIHVIIKRIAALEVRREINRLGHAGGSGPRALLMLNAS